MFSAVGCRFEGCIFNDINTLNAGFGNGQEQSEYINCSFDNARMDRIGGGLARFVGCTFRNVDIGDWICFAVELVDCTFSGKISNAIFNGTVPARYRKFVGREKNEFKGNDFSAMEFMEVAFRTGIDLTKQRLPSGPEYVYLPDAASTVTRARQSVTTNSEVSAECSGPHFLDKKRPLS